MTLAAITFLVIFKKVSGSSCMNSPLRIIPQHFKLVKSGLTLGHSKTLFILFIFIKTILLSSHVCALGLSLTASFILD